MKGLPLYAFVSEQNGFCVRQHLFFACDHKADLVSKVHESNYLL